jgi:murein DD-endopeptidase MepM/ murein hydrolase activator NlpD
MVKFGALKKIPRPGRIAFISVLGFAFMGVIGTAWSLNGTPANEAQAATRIVSVEPANIASLPDGFDRKISTGSRISRDVTRSVVAKRGTTFMKLLRSVGISRKEAHAAIRAMRKIFDPRDLRPGQSVKIHFRAGEPDKAKRRFTGFSFDPAIEKTIRVLRDANGKFKANQFARLLLKNDVRISGTIKTSLYVAARKQGLPAGALVKLIRLFSWDVDFQRGIQKGDTFDVMVERLHHQDGSVAGWGDILFAELKLSGKAIRMYRFESPNGSVEYFDDRGHSAQKALMRTPIDGARLSSGYGPRRHPILGYNRMHRGLDFAAPRGTPFYAAGNGTVVRAGRNGAYGNYIRIRHNNRYQTAYAHLRKFARGIRTGSRVKQGQVIGYVGTTGRSTGPHLHYEILVGGKQTNPRRVKMPSGRKLKGKEMKLFTDSRTLLESRLAVLPTTQGKTRVTSR